MKPQLSKTRLVLLLPLVGLGFAACATKGPPKVIAREGDNDAVVYLKNTDLRQGDHLVLLSERCDEKEPDKKCDQKVVGHATVLQRLNERYARVRLDGAVRVYEGQPVEEHIH